MMVNHPYILHNFSWKCIKILVLLVEEIRVPGRIHWLPARQRYTFLHNIVSLNILFPKTFILFGFSILLNVSVPDEGYSWSVPDEGYSWNTKLDIYVFTIYFQRQYQPVLTYYTQTTQEGSTLHCILIMAERLTTSMNCWLITNME